MRGFKYALEKKQVPDGSSVVLYNVKTSKGNKGDKGKLVGIGRRRWYGGLSLARLQESREELRCFWFNVGGCCSRGNEYLSTVWGAIAVLLILHLHEPAASIPSHDAMLGLHRHHRDPRQRRASRTGMVRKAPERGKEKKSHTVSATVAATSRFPHFPFSLSCLGFFAFLCVSAWHCRGCG